MPGPEGDDGVAVAQIDASKLSVVAADLAARIKSAARTPSVMQPLAPPGVLPAKAIKPGVERWPVKTGADRTRRASAGTISRGLAAMALSKPPWRNSSISLARGI